MTAELHTRRNILTTGAAVAGVAVGTVALAACGSDSGSGAAPAGPVAAGATLATLADIPVGESMTTKTADGQEIVVSRPTETTAAAFSAICTHQGCTVKAAGAVLNCPCHGSEFDALTGAVKKGPATSPLPAVNVKVADGKVVTG
jgi:Rieske Fe-S protein